MFKRMNSNEQWIWISQLWRNDVFSQACCLEPMVSAGGGAYWPALYKPKRTAASPRCLFNRRLSVFSIHQVFSVDSNILQSWLAGSFSSVATGNWTATKRALKSSPIHWIRPNSTQTPVRNNVISFSFLFTRHKHRPLRASALTIDREMTFTRDFWQVASHHLEPLSRCSYYLSFLQGKPVFSS